MAFAHLHLHTEYSLLDGCCRIEPLLDAVCARGQSAVAITDHGVMYGAVQFYKAALSRGLKPIIGCEVYVAPNSRLEKQKTADVPYHHLVLLCENNTGYQNLIKLVSRGFTEGFYGKPRVDKSLLEQYHEGLIALSACLAGELPQALLQGDFSAAEAVASYYRNLFGAQNYFIELQDHGLAQQKQINPLLIQLADKLKIGLVVTNDVHYIEAEDYRIHKVLLCVQTGTKMNEENPIEFKTNEFYLKSEAEMAALFPKRPDAVENTAKIAERCTVTFTFGQIKLPFFNTEGEDHAAFFRRHCYEGAHRIYGEVLPQAVCDRLEYELSVIEKMGYVDYYLIVWDFVHYAKRSGIPVGPGRGSGAGSLAAYCIGITGIDPLRYNLLFERFLNPERVSMPDFDIDFCYVNRQRVIDYVTEKYGRDQVAQIVTFGTMAARAAIRDVGRAMDLPYNTCDRVAKLIPHAPDMTIDRALEGSKELRGLYDGDAQIRDLVDTARKLEGMPRHASTHAAGVVIADRAVSDYVPLATSDGAAVTQFTMTELEELGLLKMDFLGLRNLTVIADTAASVRRDGDALDMEKIPIDDAATFAMMGKGLTDGVFQFESDGMKNVLRRFGPENSEDLIAIISLYRPGPMDSIDKYIHNRHHPQDVAYATPLLEPILSVTYGCIVYQEQVMQIFRTLAGYSFGRADVVRRAMAKKKHTVMQKERQTFLHGETDAAGNIIIDGAIRRGVPQAVAEQIFDEMSAFSSYAFNKSHAAAYALVAYRTAYLKCHYPKAYMAALLTSVLDHAGKVSQYTAESKRMGIAMLPPSVNESYESFTPTADGIRFGLLAIKNLGRGVIDRLIAERRQNGAYQSLYDFCRRNCGRDLNRRAVEGLIKSGALDGLGNNRRQMIFHLDRVLSLAEQQHRVSGNGQLDLFGEAGESCEPVLAPVDEMPRAQMLAMEREATGLYLSGHPMDDYENFVRIGRYACPADVAAHRLKDGRTVTLVGVLGEVHLRQTKRKTVIATTSIEDVAAAVPVVVIGDTFARLRPLLTAGSVVLLTGRISDKEDQETEILCEKIELPPPDAQQNSATKGDKTLWLRFEQQDADLQQKVKQLLRMHPGTTPVLLYFADTGKRLAAEKSLYCTAAPQTLAAFCRLLGEKNVRLVEKR